MRILTKEKLVFSFFPSITFKSQQVGLFFITLFVFPACFMIIILEYLHPVNTPPPPVFLNDIWCYLKGQRSCDGLFYL